MTTAPVVKLRRVYMDEDMTVAHRLKRCHEGVILIDNPREVDRDLLCPKCLNGKHKEVQPRKS